MVSAIQSVPVVTVTVKISSSAPANHEGIIKVNDHTLVSLKTHNVIGIADVAGLKVSVVVDWLKCVPLATQTIKTGNGIHLDLNT